MAAAKKTAPKKASPAKKAGAKKAAVKPAAMKKKAASATKKATAQKKAAPNPAARKKTAAKPSAKKQAAKKPAAKKPAAKKSAAKKSAAKKSATKRQAPVRKKAAAKGRLAVGKGRSKKTETITQEQLLSVPAEPVDEPTPIPTAKASVVRPVAPKSKQPRRPRTKVVAMSSTKTPSKKTVKKKAGSYDADSIETLEGLEAVRKRPGMYIGGTGSAGLSHLLWELIDNSVDEAAAGHAKNCDVVFHRDGSFEVSDNGRGIPIDRHEKKKVSALEVVLTELHAGGKFGAGAYAASGGLHGVGASVVNALSKKLTAEVDRGGKTHRLSFKARKAGRFDGDKFVAGHDLEEVKSVPARRTGTRIRFWPDTDIFDDDSTISYDEVRERVATMCFLVPGLKISLLDKRRGGLGEKEEFVSSGGLVDFVDHLSVGENLTDIATVFGEGTFEEKVPQDGKMVLLERTCNVEIAFRWVKGYEANVVSFVNTIPTPEGGTHMVGFERAMTWVANNVLIAEAKKLKRLKDDGKAKNEDVQEGLVAAVKVILPEPQFKGQTKQELGTPQVQTIVYNIAKSGFTDWIDGGGKKSHVNAVRDKVVEAVITRVTQRQQRENLRRASSLGSTGMPDKLADCRTHDVDMSELLIVEGDSAAGPAKAGRNSELQAVLPIRGKIINAGKATIKQVLDNAEAEAIFTAVGAGSGTEFQIDSRRYGRIVILADADVDGSHIRCLLLTLFFHYMKPMLEAGRIFVAMPPLYTITEKRKGSQKHYCYDDDERDAIVAKLEAKGTGYAIGRNKGLGEMNVDELAYTTLEPATRVLRQVTMDGAEQEAAALEAFDILMGKEVAPRRDYIVSNAADFDKESLDI